MLQLINGATMLRKTATLPSLLNRGFHSTSLPLSPPKNTSPPPKKFMSLGYLAGIQSSGPNASFDSFDEADDLLQTVAEQDPTLLSEFEDDLWKNSRQQFVYSTKSISVIDTDP